MKKLLLLCLLVLCGCTSETHQATIINTNQFIQEDYDYMCLDGTKTFTQIIVCYQTQDKSEKAQNHITNKLIKE